MQVSKYWPTPGSFPCHCPFHEDCSFLRMAALSPQVITSWEPHLVLSVSSFLCLVIMRKSPKSLPLVRCHVMGAHKALWVECGIWNQAELGNASSFFWHWSSFSPDLRQSLHVWGSHELHSTGELHGSGLGLSRPTTPSPSHASCQSL